MKEITSVNNFYIKDLLKLKQKKYRDESKMFLVEGYHLVEEAKDYLETVLVCKKEDINKYPNKDYILVKEEIIEKLSDTKTPQGIIGVCHTKEEKSINGNIILLLDGLQDPGNIGTILRTAISFGVETVVFSETCVDIYNEKVIRGSQGAIFKINTLKRDLNNIVIDLKKQGYTTIGTALRNAIDLYELPNYLNTKKLLNCKYVLIMGNEGNGVSEEILNTTDINAYIPIKKMESLNVGIATGIMLFYLRGLIK